MRSLPISDKEVEEINPVINEYIDRQEQQLLPVFERIVKDANNAKLIEEFMAPVVYVKTTMHRKTEICKFPVCLP